MIDVRQVVTTDELAEVRKAMRVYTPKVNDDVVGLWYQGNCIGGVFVTGVYPYEFVLEVYHKGYCLGLALAVAVGMLFGRRQVIYARVSHKNRQAIKLARQLGFVMVRFDEEYAYYELAKDAFKLSKRYPV